MSKARNLADLLDASGDVSTAALDNVPPNTALVDSADNTVLDTATGNVGIGTSSPSSKLEVLDGKITAGTASSPVGSVVLESQYSDGAIAIWGTERSSGGAVMGTGVTPSTTTPGEFFSSSGVPLNRGAYTISGNTHKWYIGNAQTVPVGSPVSISEAMRIDYAGRVTMPYQPVFDVAYSGSGYGTANPVVFNIVYSNIGGHYNTSNGRFTAPISGTYVFYTTQIKNNFTGTVRRQFRVNNNTILGGRHFRLDGGTNYSDNAMYSHTIYLNAGDFVTVAVYEGNSYGTTEYDVFGGYLLG